MNKKGMALGDLAPVAITFVVATIVISLGATLLDDFQDEQTANSYAYNITEKGLEGNYTFGSYLPTIALIVVVVIIIGLLVRYLMRSA